MSIEEHITVKSDGLRTVDAAIQWARRTCRDHFAGCRILNVNVYPPFDMPPVPFGPEGVPGVSSDTWTASVTAIRTTDKGEWT